ncbi:hypothetical protein LEMLEM_LOCUS24583 [Lemmus lemmus]
MQVRSQSLSGHQIKQTLLEAPRAQSIPEGTFTWSPPSLTLILPERRNRRPELEESESNGEHSGIMECPPPPLARHRCHAHLHQGRFSERSSCPEAKINSLGGLKKVSAVQGHLQRTWDLSPASTHFGAHTVYNSSSREPSASF